LKRDIKTVRVTAQRVERKILHGVLLRWLNHPQERGGLMNVICSVQNSLTKYGSVDVHMCKLAPSRITKYKNLCR